MSSRCPSLGVVSIFHSRQWWWRGCVASDDIDHRHIRCVREVGSLAYQIVSTARYIATAVSVAPWCTHCKTLAPEFERAAQKTAGDAGLPVQFGSVDITTEEKLRTRFLVFSFPTVSLYGVMLPRG